MMMLSHGLGCVAALLVLADAVAARTITHDFNITWVTSNPDGAFNRPTIGINGKWPIPRIEADIGDRLIVNVNNQLGNQSTSLHFHGLFQNGTTQMDGPAGVTQCTIVPGDSFTYNFTIDQPGTYWYHSHTHGQYPDGLRGPLIVNDPDFPYEKEVDEVAILTLSDWYHDEIEVLMPKFMAKSNPSGAEPVPNAALMNETMGFKYPVKPATTYLFRVLNMGAFAGQYLWFEGHTMKIVEVDGVYTEQAEAEMIYLSAAQRVSFLLTTKNTTSKNFPIVASMDTTLFDVLPKDLNYNSTGWLVYDEGNDNPPAATVETLDPFDDYTLVPYDRMPRLQDPDRSVQLDVMMDNLRDGKNYAFFNNITYVSPKVPSLYTALNAGDRATDPAVYGTYTHPFVLDKDEIVEIVVNNLDSGRHPFHLHGHHFQVVHRSAEEAGTWEDEGVAEDALAKIPMRRDTVVIYPEGNMVLRFKANNPGVWLFHCHIEWHVASGLIATFVEAPLELQKTISIPESHYASCAKAGTAVEGNAAGNTVDYLNLAGEPRPPPKLHSGFTPRGIVALVFSCVAGVLGIVVVGWYGMSAPPDAAPAAVRHTIADADAASSAGLRSPPEAVVASPAVGSGTGRA